ncbi:unnamed protein product [Tuber melanosporum]|uniref:(Perigord truffle) hypothetical protein n=1 Tax=Tuber melanosporum (strain Mel28) TaxID=656061 RepID=D5GAG8_TUBMM|nr:uncharacterized protein GSTUM_00003639001 [Tuber melanosporum]CAZ81511.1 unnamed protein product [Tuber melanosporum]
MADLSTKPRSGRLLETAAFTELVDRYIEGHIHSHSAERFALSGGIRLADTDRAVVALMRVPHPPYYDTSFIAKYFKTTNYEQAHREQVELEAASLHHAGEAFQRNNNISRSPRVYNLRPERNLIAMERIRARGVRDSPQTRWAKERMIKFVRHMAVVRLAILTQVENELGVPRHSTHGGRVGPYCAFVWWDMDRHKFWGRINRGPFPNRHEMILASLRRDRLVFRWMRREGLMVPVRSHFHTFNDIIEYLETTIRNIDQVPRPTRPEFFSLSHNDLQNGFNAMVRGSRVAALIDWEAGTYEPLSICVSDLVNSTDFDPRVWREHAGPNGENFHVLPYRLEADPIEANLAHSTRRGAERKPFPDWELIDNNGGPLDEEDFCGDNYPEDISSDDDESIVDAAEMHCDSDVDAEVEWVFPTIPGVEGITKKVPGGKGGRPYRIERDWYYQPVYALMKEFIHHQRGAGLGPNGEWGRLPEEYSRPLAEWEDPLFARVTESHFIARHNQLIDEDKVDGAVAQAAPGPGPTPKGPGPTKKGPSPTKKGTSPAQKVPALARKVPTPTQDVPTPIQSPQPKMRKTSQRWRRVPTLTGSAHDDAVVRPEVSPESPVSSSSSDYLGRNRPRRVRPKSPPTTTWKASRNRSPIPRSALQRAREPRKAKQWAEVDHPPVEAPPPDDDTLVKGVRDSIMAKVMEQLMVGPDSDAGVPQGARR